LQAPRAGSHPHRERWPFVQMSDVHASLRAYIMAMGERQE
jgi:hypothetical protein